MSELKGEEKTATWGIVERPGIPAWEANEARKRKEKKEEARRQRLARIVAGLALEVLGDGERQRIETETSGASEGHLRAWRRRAAYASTWSELAGTAPLEGLRFVSCEDLLRHAIDDPLNCWCILLLFTPSRDEITDYDRIRYGAPWVCEARDSLFGIIEELREHRRAVVTCPSERVARGLVSTITEKRLGARVYCPRGRATHHEEKR
ncbi:MAG TPA: hypothetical protein VIA62_16395 [Thermoanaerobaculia bacterium]|jgi:hypothetical protein|nr:hypothetical protein [Thermoanaerobaculia bacterium]